MIFDNLRKKDETEINMMSPLTWAYVGDSVYEVYIRTFLSENTNLNTNKMHIESIKYVKAESQTKILRDIEENLTEEEIKIVKRGRNTQNHHLPKHSSVEEYSYSTGFEALIGYLFLTKKDERLKQILEMCIKNR